MMPYQILANASDDEHAPDWRNEEDGFTNLAVAEAKSEEYRRSGKFSEVIVVGYNSDTEQWE